MSSKARQSLNALFPITVTVWLFSICFSCGQSAIAAVENPTLPCKFNTTVFKFGHFAKA